MSTKRGVEILLKAVIINFFTFFIFFPKMVYMSRHKEKYTDDELYAYGLKIVRVAVNTAGLKIEAQGLENIPQTDGIYICANHQEKFDPLAIWLSFPRQTGVILDDSATHRPVIRELCDLIKSQRLLKHNTHSVVKAYNQITRELKAGINYMVFPEGEYEEEPGMLGDFHAGSFKSPQRAHCPILPVALIDSYKIFDKGFKSTLPIRVHYLLPIKPEEYAGMTTSEIAGLVKSRIQAHLDLYQQ